MDEHLTKGASMAKSEVFATNLLKMVAAELHWLNCATAARDLFSKSYVALSPAEKVLVDRTLVEGIAANYAALTPENLAQQQQKNPVGFVQPKTAS